MSTESNGTHAQHELPAELRDADDAPLAPRRRSGAAVAMTIALIGALVLLAIAPFQLVAQSNSAEHQKAFNSADWDKIQLIIDSYDGPASERIGDTAMRSITMDNDSRVFAFHGRSAEGAIVLGVVRPDGASARTSAPVGEKEASAIFQLPGDDRYMLVWVSSPDETSGSMTLNFFTDRADAERALESGSTALPAR